MNEPSKEEKVPNMLMGIWLAVWLTATAVLDSWQLGFTAACVFTLLVLAAMQGWIAGFAVWLFPIIKSVFVNMLPDRIVEEATEKRPLYDVILGNEPETGKPVIVNLRKTGHILFAGTTGFGKTTFSQWIIHQLVGSHTERDLQLVILDGKGLSFLVWNNLPHMLRPVARTQNEITQALHDVAAEMKRRNDLMTEQGELGRICQNIIEYEEITGKRLPMILVYIDEKAEAIEPKSDADEILTTLGRLGRSAGIVLMVGNQTLYVENVSGKLSSNFATKICFYMPSSRAKGVVSQIPSEFHEQMRPVPGLAYVYSPQIQHRMFRSRMVSNQKLERRAKELSTDTPHRWQAIEKQNKVTEPAKATLTESFKSWSDYDRATKMQRLRSYVNRLGRLPTSTELMEQFDMTRPTALTWLKKIPTDWVK